jgi:hypothetical protein
MADTTQTTTTTVPTVATAVATPVLTQSQIQAATQPLLDDAIQAAHEVNALIAAHKAGGLSAVSKLLPALAPIVEKDYEDVKAVLPVIKVGYITTEFWIVVLVEAAIGVYTYLGKIPPVDGSATMAALAGVYAVVRGLLKK